jgi:hypothetical protein
MRISAKGTLSGSSKRAALRMRSKSGFTSMVYSFDIRFLILDMAAKRRKKHKNKISGLVISTLKT